MAVEFRVLGDLTVRIGDRPVDIGHARQQCVLLALVIDANQLVSADQLVDRVWAGRPPQRVRGALYNYVSRLRRILADSDDVTVTRRSGGYLLTVDALAVDLHLFDHLTARARAADDQEAGALFARALGLWRGEAFATLDTPWLNAVRDAANNRRTAAELDRYDVELRCGRHGDILPELSGRAAALPLDERLAGQLILALYRCGRQADALDHYRRTRARLAEELGIDPGPALRALHQQILTAAPTLDAPTVRARPPVSPHTATPPRQLPAPPRSFTGRGGELAQLDAVLAGGARSAETRTVAVSGTAGVGKTSLAVHWAHRVAVHFPDGQLYVNLRGFDPSGSATPVGEAVRGFIDAFGVPPHQVPAGLDAQVGLYRSLLAGRRVLVLLDNARDADQVRPLLPGSPGCMSVVTSRNQLAGIVVTEGARALRLDLLSPPEAEELLASRIGVDRLAAEPAVAARLVAACARLPLALCVVASRAALQPGLSLAALVRELGEEWDGAVRDGLDAFRAGDSATDLRAVFSWSYRLLGPGAARLLRLLSQYPGDDIGLSAAVSLAGVDRGHIRRDLTELTEAGLLTERVPARYALHDLLKAYAGELLHEVDEPADREAALHRLLDHYLHTAHAAALLIHPPFSTVSLTPPRPGAIPHTLADRAAAEEWLTAERTVLLAAIRQAARSGFGRHAWQLAWAVAGYLDRRGFWQEWYGVQELALAAAARDGDRRGHAHAHRDLARVCSRLGRHDAAHAHLSRAVELFEAVGDRAGLAHTHLNLGQALERDGRHREALEHSQRALALFTATGSAAGRAYTLNAVGWQFALLGDYRQAVASCEEALPRLRAVGDQQGEADTWDSLGYAHHRLGDHERAIACYRRALAMCAASGDRYAEASTLDHLGETYLAAADVSAAREAWCQALTILRQLGHADAVRVGTRLTDLDRVTTPG